MAGGITVAEAKLIVEAGGIRTGSRAAGGKQAAEFETAAAITARAEQSAIPLSAVAPTNQFAPLASLGADLRRPGSLTAVDCRGGVRQRWRHLLPNLVAERHVRNRAFRHAGNLRPVTSRPVLTTSRVFISRNTRTIILAGTNNNLAVGDHVLTVEPSEFQPTLFSSFLRKREGGNTTTIAWREPAGKTYQQTSPSRCNCSALRVKAGYSEIPPRHGLRFRQTLTNSDGKHDPPLEPSFKRTRTIRG